jgi:anti-anti-sigma regulatory factor
MNQSGLPMTASACTRHASWTIIDSAGLGVLLDRWAHAQHTGLQYALSGMSQRVHTIFELTHTDTVLPIFKTQAEAEVSFGA